MNSRTFRGVGAFISAGALVATVSIAGCGDSDGSNQRDVELPSPDHVDATMVAETVLSERHLVRLYRLDSGGMAIHELVHEDEQATLTSWSGRGSLIDFVHAQIPTLAVPPPFTTEPIDAAQNASLIPPTRPSARTPKSANQPKDDRPRLAPPPARQAAADTLLLDSPTQEPSPTPQATVASSSGRAPDGLGSTPSSGTAQPTAKGIVSTNGFDWGADAAAWANKYCSNANDGWGNTVAWFDGIWCPTNVGWAISGYRPTIDFEARGMNASFTASATNWVEQWTGTTWDRFISVSVPPRYQSLWIFDANQTYRSGISGDIVDFSIRYRRQMPATTELGDYPFDFSDWAYDLTDNLQGVANDGTNWYFTNMMDIAKTNVGTALENFSPVTYRMPVPWQQAGFNHMGDLVYANGLLYVPMEGSQRAIGVFTTALTYIGYAIIPQDHAAWLAYNPRDGLFYSSNEFDAVHHLNKYKITVNGLTVNAIPEGTVSLVGNWAPILSLQGGEFSTKGNLYVSSDVAGGGIREIDVLTGFVGGRGHVTFSPGFPDEEELEGLTIWNLDNGTAPGIGGQIHLLMVDNDINTDDLYFKHFRVSSLDNL